MSERTDILIVGGGLVGASLAIALDQAGCDATLVEASAPRAGAQPSYDERNLALARATVNGLRAIGVWPHAASRATAIKHIHVSRAGEFGAARIDAAEAGVDAVGWTLPARELGAALLARLDETTRLKRLAPASVKSLQPVADGWQVRIEADGQVRDIHTRLLVGADGTHSMVRQSVGIQAETYDYGQHLFVCTVTPQRAPDGRAFERFSDQGPVALLPLAAGSAGLVLTVPEDQAETVAALDDAGYLDLAQQRFGWRLGALTRPGKRFGYPIQRVASTRLTGSRAVLVGNAAQTVHPIGAQGFNLGLRDALTLAEKVAGTDDPGASALLAAYAEQRAPDREGVMAMSHGLVRLACLDEPMLAPLRSAALLAYDRFTPLRQLMARRGMGFRGRPPRQVLEVTP
ncbi:2-octaprenyl-6-methoxyphenyl hydroxylase [Oleiagrimonas sp. C23AA]|uniref:2-octaprenyl-6-methoxyphenyl hydroxylase n=1 Tax=Oleiagrimonas sp. C23AA TaxID=2719047 RepID=UPI001423957D|nr:2-octaprenyl-6-methoxyphenyl hydroxylase [Oleiagrimonas sp. C23AA]NII09923.1 2-octaprenyl-6-methoxyphenyl hydroxylase [Oleiagrimonas sp. C23AA]